MTQIAAAPAIVAEWDEDFAARIVHRVAERKLRLFAAFPEFEADDLESEGLIAARLAWHRYDPAKSAASTFIYITAARRLIDLYRQAVRHHRNDQCAANNAIVNPPHSAPRHEPNDLAEWLVMILKMIRRNMAAYRIPDRTFAAGTLSIDRAQAAALLALRHRLECTDAQLVAHLANRPRLVQALGMTSAPTAGLMTSVGKGLGKATP